MPVGLDSATANPASVQPEAGPGSKTPVSTEPTTTPVGATPAIKPQGQPGAPGQAAPGGVNPQNQINPDDTARYKAIQQALYPDIISGLKHISKIDDASSLKDVSSLSDEDINKLKDYLLDIGWESTYLFNEIFKTTNASGIREFINKVISIQDKLNTIDEQQFKNFVSQKELSVKQQDDAIKKQKSPPAAPVPPAMPGAGATVPPKAPINNIPPATPVDPNKPQAGGTPNGNLQSHASLYNDNRGESMVVEGGKVKSSSSIASTPDVLTELFTASKEASKAIDKYVDVDLMHKGASLLDPAREAGLELDVKRCAEVAAVKVSSLLDKLDEANEAKKSVTDIDTEKKFDDTISKAKGIADKGTNLFFKKKEEHKPAGEPKKDDSKPGEPKKEEPKADEPKPADEPKQANVDNSTPATVGSDVTTATIEDAKSVAAPEAKIPTNGESKVSAIIGSLRQKLKDRTAQVMPFKDLNKQVPTKVNEQVAKAQPKEIASDLAGMPKEKNEGLLGINREKGNFTAKEVDKIKKSYFDRGVGKSRLAMELACRQQLKGLLSNPLKKAFVDQAVTAGIDAEKASAIAHNAMIDGYQAAMEIVANEAFGNFVKKSSADFVKVSAATVKAAAVEDADIVTAASSQEPVQVKTASVENTANRQDLMRKVINGQIR